MKYLSDSQDWMGVLMNFIMIRSVDLTDYRVMWNREGMTFQKNG